MELLRKLKEISVKLKDFLLKLNLTGKSICSWIQNCGEKKKSGLASHGTKIKKKLRLKSWKKLRNLEAQFGQDFKKPEPQILKSFL